MHSVDELNALDSTVETIIVDNNGCNDESFTVLNLTRFVNLRVFEVGDNSFSYVEEVHLIGLSKLERVVIGKHCFTLPKWEGMNPDNSFYLKNCERLRELKIGHYSFSDYSVCEIENVPSLEVIEMGELEDGSNFRAASLELKSGNQRMK